MNKNWTVVLFENDSKEQIIDILYLPTMANIAYILNVDNNVCSNTYHQLIQPKGILKLVTILENQRNR